MAKRSGSRGATAEETAPAEAVLAEQLLLLFRNPADVPINLINAFLVALVIRPVVPGTILGCWLAVSVLVGADRAVFRYRFAHAAIASEQRIAYVPRFTVNAFIAGCTWGFIGPAVLLHSDMTMLNFVIFALAGTMVGGVVCTNSYLPDMLAFILPTMLPTIVALAFRGGLLATVMAVMLALFTIAITMTGCGFNRSIIENIRLRFARDDFVAKLQASESAMALSQSIAHVGTWNVDLVTHRDVWSAETFRIFGVDPKTFTPSFKALLERVHPDDRSRMRADYAQILSSGTSPGIDHRIVMDDGTIKYVHDRSRAVYDGEHHPIRLIGTVQDITARQTSENAIRFANLLLKSQMESSPYAIMVGDVNDKILLFNQRLVTMWSVSAETLAHLTVREAIDLVAPMLIDPKWFADRGREIVARPDDDSHDEFAMVDGRTISCDNVVISGTPGEYLGRVWYFRDITERKRSEAEALRVARDDVLTGLANRAVFVDDLNHAIASAKRDGAGFAVLYMDLDHFKDVNDTLGHPVGDELLKAVALRLRESMRETDTIARFGGDEFAVIVSDVRDPAIVGLLAEKLIDAFGRTFAVAGSEIHSGVSIGIAVYGPDAPDAETLLSHADVALYRAKAEGRGGYRFFTGTMDTEVKARVALGAQLRVAVDKGQLFLEYQPQVVIATGAVTGVEALVRWRHPTRGVLAPMVFIPIAEQIGIISNIGHFVLWEACRQGKAWLDAGIPPVRISVNISALQFRSPLVLESDIAEALAHTGFPARLLELELTESVLMDVSREHRDLLARLRATGVTVAIDDFGTGYSSLDYLRRFPSNRIKIADNFVRHMESTPGDAAIVRATIGLARELKINVIAEGVETKAQADLLEDWGCREVQGYRFAHPLAAAAAEAVLRAGTIAPA